jgi:predicted O-methyltransferase YrrM
MSKGAEELSNAFGYLRAPEVPALKKLARDLPDNPIVVNIGAGVGTSALAFLESRDDLTLFSVDIVGGIEPTGGLGNEEFALKSAGVDLSRRHAITGDSLEVARVWNRGKVDLVFIDGRHDDYYVEVEAPTWWQHVKDGGVIAFHDYAPDPWGAIVAAIDRFAAENDLVEILQVDTIIAFKKEVDDGSDVV